MVERGMSTEPGRVGAVPRQCDLVDRKGTKEQRPKKHGIYVHCSAGMNRSPSTVVAYLHWVGGMTLDEAVDVVMQRRFCDPYLDTIRQATVTWAAEGGLGQPQ